MLSRLSIFFLFWLVSTVCIPNISCEEEESEYYEEEENDDYGSGGGGDDVDEEGGFSGYVDEDEDERSTYSYEYDDEEYEERIAKVMWRKQNISFKAEVIIR